MAVIRLVSALLATAALLVAALPTPAVVAAPTADYTILRSYPHNTNAWTEGLVFWRGEFYESTGLYGRSSIRRVDLETGAVLQKRMLPDHIFGEGMAIVKGRLIVISWKEGRALVHDALSFDRLGRYTYSGEGSGLAYNGQHIVMSNLTPTIRFRDPNTFQTVRSITVRENGVPVDEINALAWVKGKIWANIWLVPDILIIDPANGNVLRRLDFSALQAHEESIGNAHDMNGIGYWKNEDRLFVTGKFWKRVYEIEILPE